METIWETETKYKIWLEIEILACEAMEKIGKIPKGTSKNIRKKANFDVNKVLEIERETKINKKEYKKNNQIINYCNTSSKSPRTTCTSLARVFK